jgi:hypothetical protein
VGSERRTLHPDADLRPEPWTHLVLTCSWNGRGSRAGAGRGSTPTRPAAASAAGIDVPDEAAAVAAAETEEGVAMTLSWPPGIVCMA